MPTHRTLADVPKIDFQVTECTNNSTNPIKSLNIFEFQQRLNSGPEGDFSDIERKLIVDLDQAYSISLAKNVLRAETAAIAATTIVSYHLIFQGFFLKKLQAF